MSNYWPAHKYHIFNNIKLLNRAIKSICPKATKVKLGQLLFTGAIFNRILLMRGKINAIKAKC